MRHEHRDLPGKGGSHSVHFAALNALQRGWSVIPLLGGDDPTTGKQSSVKWTAYQKHLPQRGELDLWFASSRREAYGVVCGQVSRLIVLDWDTPEAAARFATEFPDLLNTYTVRSGTRGMPHFYYRVSFQVNSAKLDGGDLKGEGGYVVGGGSRIGGRAWEVINACRPLVLTRDQVEAIKAAFAITLAECEYIDEEPTVISSSTGVKNGDFIGHYLHEVRQSGQRNNSLFQTALAMRDQGYSVDQALGQLTHIHAIQPGEKHESYGNREREAQRTIRSAYSRPPRKQTALNEAQEAVSTLSNGIREKLLQQSDGAAFLRTYEGLLLSGIREADIVTRPQMFGLLRGLVGEHSVKRALSACAPDGQTLFHPSPTPPSPADADPDRSGKGQNKCFVNRNIPPESRPAHRPAKRYLMPSKETLCAMLGVSTEAPRDVIQRDDLSSASKYRQTLEHRLIERKPGQYAQGWLANRLGVSIKTIYKYHKALPLEVVPSYVAEEITWDNVGFRFPAPEIAACVGVDLRGKCLQDERGKRYPAIRGIAYRLLGQGHKVWLRQRTFNHYRCESEVRAAVSEHSAVNMTKAVGFPHIHKPDFRVNEQLHAEDKPQREIVVLKTAPQSEVISEMSNISPAIKRPDKRVVARTAADVHKLTNEIDSSHAMSQRNAERLVEQYGVENVERAIRTLWHLHQKGRVQNPAGFMVVAARANWKRDHTHRLLQPVSLAHQNERRS